MDCIKEFLNCSNLWDCNLQLRLQEWVADKRTRKNLFVFFLIAVVILPFFYLFIMGYEIFPYLLIWFICTVCFTLISCKAYCCSRDKVLGKVIEGACCCLPCVTQVDPKNLVRPRCPLCNNRINGKKWTDGSHRTKCKSKNKAFLDKYVTMVFPELSCPKCQGEMRLWSHPNQPGSFACVSGKPACPNSGQLYGLPNTGTNFYVCFDCDVKYCIKCCDQMIKERPSKASAIHLPMPPEAHAASPPDDAQPVEENDAQGANEASAQQLELANSSANAMDIEVVVEPPPSYEQSV